MDISNLFDGLVITLFDGLITAIVVGIFLWKYQQRLTEAHKEYQVNVERRRKIEDEFFEKIKVAKLNIHEFMLFYTHFPQYENKKEGKEMDLQSVLKNTQIAMEKEKEVCNGIKLSLQDAKNYLSQNRIILEKYVDLFLQVQLEYDVLSANFEQRNGEKMMTSAKNVFMLLNELECIYLGIYKEYNKTKDKELGERMHGSPW